MSPPAPSAPRPTPTVARPRFALETGPFLDRAEAERIERRLRAAGNEPVRVQRQSDIPVYAVQLDGLPDRRAAEAAVNRLREQGFPDATLLDGVGDAVEVGIGAPLPLHAAVQLARRVGQAGHEVRVSARPGRAVAFTLRHGRFASRRQAEARAAELDRLGVPSFVVTAR